ncbi:hypothetical protein Gogos_002074 [Gossypium gossypioides]|uniref:Uncharacterized protein n=1 Tax=Gossypium gossypioides TaxID=34282 RepID=A0A7J9CR32_GOSGO|nr:hypothetical protein [Gossypium gossypioides]
MRTCYSWFKQGESFGSGPEILEEIRRDTNQVGEKQISHERIYGACGAFYRGGANGSKPTRGVCNNAQGRSSFHSASRKHM